MKELGRVGGKALIYFAVMSIVALIIGLIGGHIISTAPDLMLSFPLWIPQR